MANARKFGERSQEQFDPTWEWRLGSNRRNLQPNSHMICSGLSDPDPEARQRSRRYIEAQDHMENEGVAAVSPASHGIGRRYIEAEDHQVTRGDHIPLSPPFKGRRHIIPTDHVKTEVLQHTTQTNMRLTREEELKANIRDALEARNITVYDERRWSEAVGQPRGVHWVLEAVTETSHVIGVEGRNAQLIAERLSMKQVAELRSFGLRFSPKRSAGSDVCQVHRQKRSTYSLNPSLSSQGVDGAMMGGYGYAAIAA